MSITAYLKSAKIVSIIVIIIVVITYITVITIKNKNLQKEINELNITIALQKDRISRADSAINLQNEKIQQLAIDTETKQKEYNSLLIEIEKYKIEKKYQIGNLDNATCEDKLDIILQLQKEWSKSHE